jgi:hypothetical protein
MCLPLPPPHFQAEIDWGSMLTVPILVAMFLS